MITAIKNNYFSLIGHRYENNCFNIIDNYFKKNCHNLIGPRYSYSAIDVRHIYVREGCNHQRGNDIQPNIDHFLPAKILIIKSCNHLPDF